MARLAALASKLRSKNAGPFWITVDIFCPDAAVYERVAGGLDVASVARRLKLPQESIKRYAIANLNVVKFSLHRPQVQGSRHDRDMHGAQLAIIFGEMEVD